MIEGLCSFPRRGRCKRYGFDDRRDGFHTPATEPRDRREEGAAHDRAHHLGGLAPRAEAGEDPGPPPTSAPRGVPGRADGDAPAHPRGEAAEAVEEQDGRRRAGRGPADGEAMGGRRAPRRLRPARAPRRHGHRPGRRRSALRQRDRRRRALRHGCRCVPRRVPGHERRRDRVRVARPVAADPGVHPPVARRRVRVEGGAAHRQRGCARRAAAALPVRRRAGALLGRRLRPAVVRDRGSGDPDQPAHRRQRVPLRGDGP